MAQKTGTTNRLSFLDPFPSVHARFAHLKQIRNCVYKSLRRQLNNHNISK